MSTPELLRGWGTAPPAEAPALRPAAVVPAGAAERRDAPPRWWYGFGPKPFIASAWRSRGPGRCSCTRASSRRCAPPSGRAATSPCSAPFSRAWSGERFDAPLLVSLRRRPRHGRPAALGAGAPPGAAAAVPRLAAEPAVRADRAAAAVVDAARAGDRGLARARRAADPGLAGRRWGRSRRSARWPATPTSTRRTRSPRSSRTGPCSTGTGLGHPLIPDAACVRNDVRLDARAAAAARQRLEHVGQEHAAAHGRPQRGARAGRRARCARRRCASRRSSLGASIRIQDSLQQGASRFYAEITRLRQIVDLARERPPLLFLLDEILHGTNSERPPRRRRGRRARAAAARRASAW